VGKPKAPTPPDPKETSAASTSTNVGTAIANAFMGNVNQVTPDGTLNYDQTGTYNWNDPYTGESYDIPRFTATQTLSPEQQAIQGQQRGAELNLSTLANNQSGFLNDYMAEPFSYDPGQHEGWALGLYDKLNNDKISQDSEALRSRLADQGIKAGSEAYNREMQAFGSGNMDSRNRFLLDSYKTGFGTAQAERNQPINEITALLSGSQVSQPNFVNAQQPTIPTTDTAGLINENYNQQMGLYQQRMAQSQNLLGGLFGLGSSLIMSDKRTKENIRKVGEVEGNPVYSYSYKHDPEHRKHIGVMAQEAEKKNPDAVETIGGIKHVNYGELFGMGAAA
jgi:hypothetical protein